MADLDRVAGHDLTPQNPLTGADRGEGTPVTAAQSLTEISEDLERWLAALAPLWAACRLNCTPAASSPTTSAATLLTEARDAMTCRAFEADFEAAQSELTADLGAYFQGLRTEWPRS